MITQVPQISCILDSKTVAWQAKCCEKKEQEQGSCVALNRQEVTAIAGVTQAAFHSVLIGEHRTAQTVWFPHAAECPCSQASDGESCARQVGCTARIRGVA